MKLRFENIAYSMLFLMIIFMQTGLGKYTLFLTFITFIMLLLKKPKIFIATYTDLKHLFLLLIIGFILGLLHLVNNNSYFFGKDIYFFIQPLIYILFGAYLYSVTKDLYKILKVIIYATFSITLFKMAELIIDPINFYKVLSGSSSYASLINYSALIGLAIIVYSKQVKIKLLSRYAEIIILFLYLLSILLSFSRTTYVVFVLILLIPYLARVKLLTKVYWLSVFLILFSIFGGLLMNENKEGSLKNDNSFQAKLQHSFDEIIIRNYNSISEINENWRGYEANLGLVKYYEGNLGELIFGQGFGTVVYTPFWIFKGSKLEIIPRFHNGYITILLKTGILGLIIFFLFLYNLLKIANRQYLSSKYIGLLLQMSVFMILFFTLVIHGIFTTEPQIVLLILIGVLMKVSNDGKIKKVNVI